MTDPQFPYAPDPHAIWTLPDDDILPEDQIETRPEANAIYVANAGPFGLRRWTGELWQSCGGWSPCPDPGVIRKLIHGPMLVPHREEPKATGAVVEEFPSGVIYVRTVDGTWVGPGGATKTWREISYPVPKFGGRS